MQINQTNCVGNIKRNNTIHEQINFRAIPNDTYTSSDKDEKAKRNKKLLGIGIAAAVVLLGVIFRKKIKSFLRGNVESPPKTESGLESKPPTPGETVVGPKGSIVLPQKTHIEQYQELLDQSNEAWAKSNEATAKNGGFYDEQLKEAAHKASRECSAFEEKAGKENFSLVVKKNLANVTNEEKLEYFTKHVFPRMKCSEASAFDGLDMFEKDGIRERYGKDNIKKTLESLTAAIPKNPSDGLISRYVDVYGKYAQKVSKDFRDSDMFAFFLSGKYRATGDIRQNISEETLLKAIALLKKITYRGEDATTLECAYTGKQFESTRFKNNPKVIAAVEDFKEYVKQFPLYGGQIS